MCSGRLGRHRDDGLQLLPFLDLSWKAPVSPFLPCLRAGGSQTRLEPERFSLRLHVSAEPRRLNLSEPIRGGPDSLARLIYGSGQRSS